MSGPGVAGTSQFMKLQGTEYHMFIAAVILATDLCCNRPGDAEHEQQSSELMPVCLLLASIKQQSQIAAKLLQSLTELLIKYGVWSLSFTIPPAVEQVWALDIEASQQWQFGDGLLVNRDMGQQNFDIPLEFDGLWETFIEKSSALDLIDVK
jgi:hypothetical protein